jgi:hypothetical protein
MLLKGPNSGGYIHIDQNVLFKRAVISRYLSPWSEIWFVDGVGGKADGSGKTPTDAVNTIALGVAKAARGDTVLIRPQDYAIGHGMERYTECVTLTATNTGLNYAGGTTYPILTPSDISIIGIMSNRNPEFGVRWKFGTTYCLINDTPGLHVENIGFFDASIETWRSCSKKGSSGRICTTG